jgi:hypothetical protein
VIAELYASATPERIPELIEALHRAVNAHIEAVEIRDLHVDARQRRRRTGARRQSAGEGTVTGYRHGSAFDKRSA